MTASDIPESWHNQEAMIRALVSYLPNDQTVRQAVGDQFGKLPSSLEVARLRKAHNRKRARSDNEYSRTGLPLDGKDGQLRNAQRKADRRFLNALYLSYPERRPA